MTDHDEPDLALLRGLLHPRMSRRGFLRTAGVGAAGLSLSGLLAACGGTAEPSPSASPAGTGATGAGYFWPGWVLGGWGIGLLFHAWATFGQKPIHEDEIRREMDRLRRREGASH